jgi:hypothetical protein
MCRSSTIAFLLLSSLCLYDAMDNHIGVIYSSSAPSFHLAACIERIIVKLVVMRKSRTRVHDFQPLYSG